MHPRMVPMPFDAVGAVLLHLVNSSISLRCTPILENSLVQPIHKTSDPPIHSNFQPISIVPEVSKAVEQTVHQKLCNYLAKIAFPQLSTVFGIVNRLKPPDIHIRPYPIRQRPGRVIPPSPTVANVLM